MIEFITLFLGLVAGPQTIEVAVGEGVAAVEIRLDEAVLGRIAGAPWRLEADLGPELLPRRLTALALDGEGNELGRAVQALNRPRPPAEAGVILERDAAGRPVAARLTWESLEGRLPLRVAATFDGEPLPAPDPERIELPAHDPGRFHVFHARLEFAGDVTASAQVGFGGAHAEAVGSGLTAVPLAIVKGKRLDERDLERWLASAAGSIEVAGVEMGDARVTMVRSGGVVETMERLEGRDIAPSNPGVVSTSRSGPATVGDLAPAATATASERLREAVGLGDATAVSVLLPRARRARGHRLGLELFAASPEMTRDQGGLYRALTQGVHLPGLADEQRIADAVAIAGLGAATGSRRRAVVLVVADRLDDSSLFSAATVRRFLAALDVPLVVWRLGEGAVAGWPEAVEIPDFRALRRAARELERRLDRQRIVWLHGEHDPAAVRLAAGAGVTRLSGDRR